MWVITEQDMMEKSDYNEFDYIIGMDSANIRNIGRIVGNDRDGKVYKLLHFAGEERDIADPWYTGNLMQLMMMC